MKILGLDMSLSATGYCFIDYETGVISSSGEIKTIPKLITADRIFDIVQEIRKLVSTVNVADVVIEQPIVFGSAEVAMKLNQLFGATMYALHDLAPIPVNVTELKKWATGKGNAKKPEMIAKACELSGLHIISDNIADAFLGARWGREVVMEAVANG